MSDKQNFQEERNNRQIILWGANGQEAVDNAHIVVLGSDCVASEFLKNIVLHGFGNVTIIDDANVNKEDIMSNFLVDANDLGKPRAESVANLLRELNDTIKVEAKVKSPTDLSFINEEPKPGFIVTCGNLKPSFLAELNKLCREKHIPQGHVQSVGLFGAFYLDAGLHEIYEGPSATNNPYYEVRALKPFPELLEYFKYCQSLTKDSPEYYFIPSPAFFYIAIQNIEKSGGLTSNPIQRPKVIRSAIDKLDVNPLEPIPSILEAKAKIGDYLRDRTPENPLKVFQISEEHPEVNTPFWRMARATSRFYKAHGVLPHYGGCPDLETSTKNYLHIKKIYEEKSKKDWEEIRNDLAQRNEQVSEGVFSNFLKNVYRVDAVEYKPIADSLNFLSPIMPATNAVLTVQVLFTAIRNFYEKNNRQPEDTQADQNELVEEMKKIANGRIKNETEIVDYVKEFSLSKNHIVPSVAATIGAIFAAEVTKIVIHQAKPVKGAFIYNGVTCTGTAF